MMERIAARVPNQPAVSLVLTDSALYALDDENGGSITLLVVEHLRTTKQKTVQEHHFPSVPVAEQFAQKEYAVALSDWIDDAPMEYEFRFRYTVTYTGVPQPHLLESSEAKVVLRLETEADADGKKVQALHICGNKEGLKRLAARLLLCADSQQYDEFFHIHLDDQDAEFTTDLPVTLRSPSYLGALLPKSIPSCTEQP